MKLTKTNILFFCTICTSSLILHGCAAGIIAGGTATLVTTKKLPTDLVAEAITGKDCSAIRAHKDGGPYCRSSQYGRYLVQKKYCYRSLGFINCYASRQPNLGRSVGN